MLTVFASAGLFVLMWAEFMAAALVLIYAGAILVTYVFVIMLAARAGAGGELSEADEVSREPVAAAAVGFGLMAVLLYVIFDKAPAVQATGTIPQDLDLSVTGLANYLFVHQLVNLELAGVMLTMAMVGAVVVARRRLWSPGARPPEMWSMRRAMTTHTISKYRVLTIRSRRSIRKPSERGGFDGHLSPGWCCPSKRWGAKARNEAFAAQDCRMDRGDDELS